MLTGNKPAGFVRQADQACIRPNLRLGRSTLATSMVPSMSSGPDKSPAQCNEWRHRRTEGEGSPSKLPGLTGVEMTASTRHGPGIKPRADAPPGSRYLALHT